MQFLVFGALSGLTGNGLSIFRFLTCLFGRGFSEKWGSVTLAVQVLIENLRKD
jgi:hypothetical protein